MPIFDKSFKERARRVASALGDILPESYIFTGHAKHHLTNMKDRLIGANRVVTVSQYTHPADHNNTYAIELRFNHPFPQIPPMQYNELTARIADKFAFRNEFDGPRRGSIGKFTLWTTDLDKYDERELAMLVCKAFGWSMSDYIVVFGSRQAARC